MRICFNNPNVRNFLLGLVEDYTRSYEVDGIMWCSERMGPLNNLLRGGVRGDRSPERDLLLRILRAKRQEARHQLRTRPGRLPGAGEISDDRGVGHAAGRWLLRQLLADSLALSGDPGVGDAVERQPA